MKTKEKSLEMAKLNVEKNFYFIGILEEFMDSLRMFELVLPRIYTRVVEALNNDWVQEVMNKTRTTHKIRMTEESKDYFRKGPLKYEIDLYEYAKSIFYQKRK